MFWYTKSNAKHDKIKTQNFQIPVNCFVKRKSMYLWHYILRIPFHGEVYVDIFKKVVPSLTTFNFLTQICHWLRWLRCFARLNIKIHFLVTTLTMRIYMKNSFITDCTDYADIQGNMKNKFITEFADYLVFNTRWELIPSLITLTTKILETSCKIILS